MHSNAIQKAAEVTAAPAEAVSAEELRLINTYTRRNLSADEVYVFSVTLCDNDVDRDNERFTVESLFALEKLFVGKTGIFDHQPSAKNQTARIFACAVEHAEGKKTATGDDYFCLRARAYMPRTEQNRSLIEAIDSGIVKEVSVGCAVDKTLCSVCGKPLDLCPHQKGETYGGRLCCGELTDPADAYEWSFVAVPAQRAAGVTEKGKQDGNDLKNVGKQKRRAAQRRRLRQAARLYRLAQADGKGRRVLPREPDRRGAASLGSCAARYFGRHDGEHCQEHDRGAAQRGKNRL